MRNDMGRNTVPPGSLAEQVKYGYPTTDMREEKLWPTPRASERMAYAEKPSPSMIKGTHGWNLNAAVTDSQSKNPHKKWPTPKATDYFPGMGDYVTETETGYSVTRKGTGQKFGAKLADAVDYEQKKMWPTPNARDWKDSMNSVPPSVGKTRGHSLGQKVASVELEKKMLPTPAARDYKGQNSMKHLLEKPRHQGQLPNRLKMMGVNGQLNPTWVEWLMGYPIGWTDLNHSETQ